MSEHRTIEERPNDLPDESELLGEVVPGALKLVVSHLYKDFEPIGRSRVKEKVAGTLAAVSDFSFEVRSSEFVVILGPSGSGKTTVLRMIAGLDMPTSGDVLIDGMPVLGPGPDRGMVFQSYTSFPWLTVKQNVLLGLRFRKDVEKHDHGAMADYYLELVGLQDFSGSYQKHLSGGMRQRVAIARTLAANPEVLLMDEPFGALDSQTRSRMQEELLQIQEQHHTTVVFVTHDIEEAIFLADRIIISTPRPAHVQTIIDVQQEGLPRPRLHEMKFMPEFSKLVALIDSIINPKGGRV